jgi:hypothetical protein
VSGLGPPWVVTSSEVREGAWQHVEARMHSSLHAAQQCVQTQVEPVPHMAEGTPQFLSYRITTCRASPGHVTGQCCKRVAVGQ